MYIIAGKYRGRKIKTERNHSYRPTTAKVKEAIFSILNSGQFVDEGGKSALEGAVTIDVFGGTGALTFEAISRGASRGFIIEKDYTNLKMIKQNIESLNLDKEVYALYGDACRLMRSKDQCDIVFIDPPFNKGLITDTIKSLLYQNWIKNEGLIVIERHINDLYEAREDCHLLFQRKYDKVWLEILQVKKEDEVS